MRGGVPRILWNSDTFDLILKSQNHYFVISPEVFFVCEFYSVLESWVKILDFKQQSRHLCESQILTFVTRPCWLTVNFLYPVGSRSLGCVLRQDKNSKCLSPPSCMGLKFGPWLNLSNVSNLTKYCQAYRLLFHLRRVAILESPVKNLTRSLRILKSKHP